MTLRATTATETFVQKPGLSNSPVAQTVHAIGNKLVGAATRRDQTAQIGLSLAEWGKHLAAVATTSIGRYDDFNRAQEAYATLNLSGMDDVLIRPQGRSSSRAGPESYDLLVRLDLATTAVAALRETQIRELSRFSEISILANAIAALKAHHIEATSRPLKRPGQGETSERVFALYVRCADEDAARKLLKISPTANGQKI